MITKEQVLEELEHSEIISLIMEDDETFDIGIASCWVGGSDEGYMCDFLGNIEFSSKKSCVNALFNYLEKEGLQIVDIDF